MTLARPSDGERAPLPGDTRAAAAKVGLGATPSSSVRSRVAAAT